MNTTVLHYFYDPLCGWCYGAAPLLQAARKIVTIDAHAGGMMTGSRRQKITPSLREYIRHHDQRIAQLSGQPFGRAYAEELLEDNSVVLDSEPPTAAILAAEEIAGRGLEMLGQLQIAHYVEGRRIAEFATLIEIATALGFNSAVFAVALSQQSGDPVQAHIRETRALMDQIGAQGFPTFALETKAGLQTVDLANFIGNPHEFQAWLGHQSRATENSPNNGNLKCDSNSCVT